MEMFKILRSSLKELSIAIIILGLLRQIIYYGNFNLPIKYFMGLSDLWLVISDDLIILGPLLFLFFYLGQRLTKIEQDKSNNSVKDEKVVDRWMMYLFIIILAILVVAFFLVDKYLTRLNIGLGVFICILILGTTLDDGVNYSASKFFPIFTVGVFLVTLVAKVSTDINSTIHGKYSGVIVETEQNKYVSNDSIFFIGKSDKYIFFHNRYDKSNTIIPIELVKRIEMKTNFGR